MRETVGLTRRVSFSSGHRYWIGSLTEAENRRLFGRWASPYNHGHNYVLEVTVEGRVEPTTGMVVNIKDIDDVLRTRIVSQFDQRSIDDEIEWFRSRASSVENLLRYIAQELEEPGVLPPEAALRRLRLEETPLLWGEMEMNTGRLSLTRVYEFAAAHRLHAPSLSHEQNLDLYGKCNNPAGHGHNYVLEVTVTGEPHPETGMLVDLELLDRAVEAEVVDRYDHKNLNCDLPEFEGRPTTSEVVAQEIFRRLEGAVPAKLARIRLLETARNIFEVVAD